MSFANNVNIANLMLNTKCVLVPYGDVADDGSGNITFDSDDITAAVAVLHFDNSGPAATMVAGAAAMTITSGVLATGITMAANDSLLIFYK